MKKNFILILVIFNLLFYKCYSQNGEFEIRKEFIGKIIKNPNKANIGYLLKQYALKSDSIHKKEELIPWHCRRNCFDIKIESNKHLLIEYETSKLENVRKEVFNFLVNPNKNVTKSDSRNRCFENGVEFPISMGIIYVTYDQRVNQNVIRLFKEIANGVMDYKYYLADEIFDIEYLKLNKKNSNELDSIVNWRIIPSNKFPPPPPPPPPFPDSLKNK